MCWCGKVQGKSCMYNIAQVFMTWMGFRQLSGELTPGNPYNYF